MGKMAMAAAFLANLVRTGWRYAASGVDRLTVAGRQAVFRRSPRLGGPRNHSHRLWSFGPRKHQRGAAHYAVSAVLYATPNGQMITR